MEKNYIELDLKLIKSPKFNKVFKKNMALYLYLRSYIIRKECGYGELDLYNIYFKKGKLAANAPIRKIAYIFQISPKTVMSSLKKMAKDGVIKIEKISQDNVYIFGTHNMDGKEMYFCEDLIK